MEYGGSERRARILDRVWRLIVDERSDSLVLNSSVADAPLSEVQERTLHKTIKAVTCDFESLSFNTAIARLMEFTNFFTKEATRPREAMESLVLLLSPMAPHLCEELWKFWDTMGVWRMCRGRYSMSQNGGSDLRNPGAGKG